MNPRFIYALGLAAAMGLPGTRAFSAQIVPPGTNGEANTLSEIVVTAERRPEKVQSVPIAMTVIPSAELERQGITSIQSLAHANAALDFTAQSAAPGGGAFIRGIGTESVGGDTTMPSVAIVLDGVPLGATNIYKIFDVASVDVLEGPQGTLFGSSASAGVISITTRAPDPRHMSARARIEYGAAGLGSKYSRRVLHAAVNLPLSARSAVRVAAVSDLNSDIWHNVNTGASSSDSDNAVRVSYLNRISDALTLNVIGDYDKATDTNDPNLTYRFAPPGSALANALTACGISASSSNFSSCSDHAYYASQEDRGILARIGLKLGRDTLTSISSYRLATTAGRFDITGIPLPIMETQFALGHPCLFYNCVPIFSIYPGGPNQAQVQDRSQVSQELRIASPNNRHLEWVAGLYYQHYHVDDNSPGTITANFGGGTFTAPTNFQAVAASSEYALYGNVTYFFNAETRLAVGARLTRNTVYERKHDPANSQSNLTYWIAAGATKPTYRVSLQRNFGAATMAYVSFATGYKAPEISDALSPNPHPGQPWNGGMFAVRPETPTDYEIGLKQSALHDRLAVDADVFYEEVKNYQGQYSFPNSQGSITTVPANVPKVVTKGVELNVFGRPWRGMSVNASGLYDPATYPANYLASDGTNLGGHQLNFAPKTKLTLSVEQSVELSDRYAVVVGADAVYRSAESLYLSANPDVVEGGGTLFNARVGLRSGQGWSLYFFGRNLSNKHFPLQIYPTPFQPGGLWQVFDANALRVVGLQLDVQVR